MMYTSLFKKITLMSRVTFKKKLFSLNPFANYPNVILYGYNNSIQKNLLVCDPKGLEYL